MKKNSLLTGILFLVICLIPQANQAQTEKNQALEKDTFAFTITHENERAPVKNQGRSSTCWSFSATSFLESEYIRLGNDPLELSVMYTVRNIYLEKADRYARWHGHVAFGPGGAFHDVIYSIQKYGIVPLEVYPGNKIKADGIMHGEMDGVLKGYMDGLIQSKKPSIAWKAGFDGLVSSYLGEMPSTFSYSGKTYTPDSFRESLGLNLDDYVEISSFSHHPFYEKFVLEVPDNWMRDEVYNVPLDELITIMAEAIESGYTVAWASDLDKGFNFNLGVGIVPPDDWDGKTFAPGMEPEITQERRQLEFDNYSTTDDHGMHFVGLAKDQNGQLYFLEKNSWGTGNKFDGYSYVSEQYVRLKTTCILVNVHSIPEHIRKKLNL